MDFNAAALFVKVVQHGSFSETARRTNIPVATVSRRIKDLERELGIRLLERSTRYLRLTDAGAKFLEYVACGVESFEMGLLAIERDRVEVSGRLRLSLPPGFIPWRKLLQEFQECYPKVNIELYITERRVDLIEDGIDVALRIGNVKDRQAIVKELGTYRHLLVASPMLLEKYARPTKPEDLLQLPCACWNSHSDRLWQLGDETIEVNPFFQVNDYLHLLDLALSGRCVTELPPFLARDYLVKGQLEHLLTDFPLPSWKLNLLYPSQKQLSHLVKIYVDFCLGWKFMLGSVE